MEYKDGVQGWSTRMEYKDGVEISSEKLMINNGCWSGHLLNHLIGRLMP
jgi:hypothetical protein